MTVSHILGLVFTIAAILALGIYSGRAAKKKKGASSWVVAGAIMGTLVGGSSTVGTAQLAYNYGMSAWWWTLGSGIACLVLALFWAKPFKQSGNKTLIAFITGEYGKRCGFTASILSSLGSFINIISQLIAATAILAVVFPNLPLAPALLISAVCMILYIIFGGTKGSGIVGILKMLLLYASMIAGGAMVLWLSGGLSGFHALVKGIDNPGNVSFYSLFARGVGTDLGACVSLIVGVITTQSYAQAVFAADDSKEAVKGALLSAALIPPVGIGGILVGLYMRAVHPGIAAKTALTLFTLEYLPPLFGGIVLGALFIAVVGTGSGLAFGIATVMKNDILAPILKRSRRRMADGMLEKLLLVILLLAACLLSMGPLGDTILAFAFMSMGLRGATIFAPLCAAMRLPGKIGSRWALGAIIAGPATVLVFGLLGGLPFDPLFVGIFVSFFIMAIGYMENRKKERNL